MGVQQGGEDNCLQGAERVEKAKGSTRGGGGRQGASPGEVPLGERAPLLCQVPFTQLAPPSPRQGVCQGPPADTRLAALSPGPAGLKQWTLSQKPKLLQNRNPPPAPPPPIAHLNSPIFHNRMVSGSPLPEIVHIHRLLSAKWAQLDPW